MINRSVRDAIKKIPYSTAAYRAIAGKRTPPSPPSYVLDRREAQAEEGREARDEFRLLNLLTYTKASGSSYSAQTYPAGYHQITVNGKTYAGQRRPKSRIESLPIDFRGKSVLDIGCNQGGMIFALEDKPSWTVGLDYDYRMINACNLIRSLSSRPDAAFYVFDIDKDPHELIWDFLPEDRVDVIFLLSVCMWVERWKDLISFCSRLTDTIIFESNGSDGQQHEQLRHLARFFPDVEVIASQSNDDENQKRRQLCVARRTRRNGL